MTSCWLKGSQNMIVCDFYAWFDLIWFDKLYWPESSKGIWTPKKCNSFHQNQNKKQTIWNQKRLLQGVHLRKSVWFIRSHIHPATTSHPSAPNRNLHIALPTWHLIAHVCGSWGSPIMSPRLSKAQNRCFGAITLFWGVGSLFSREDLLVSGRVYVYLYLVTPLSIDFTSWVAFPSPPICQFQEGFFGAFSGFHPSEKTSLPWDDVFHQAGSVFFLRILATRGLPNIKLYILLIQHPLWSSNKDSCGHFGPIRWSSPPSTKFGHVVLSDWLVLNPKPLAHLLVIY